MAARGSGGGYSGGGSESRRRRGWKGEEGRGREAKRAPGGESTFRDASEREVAAAPREVQARCLPGRGGNGAEEWRAPAGG